MSKRAVGIVEPARRPRQEVPAGAARARSSSESGALEPDHVLITGDLTTTALPAEFADARAALAAAAGRPGPCDRHPRQSRPLHDRLGPQRALRGRLRGVHAETGLPLAPPDRRRRRRSSASTPPARTSRRRAGCRVAAAGRGPLARRRPGDAPAAPDRRLPLPGRRPAGLCGRARGEADEERRGRPQPGSRRSAATSTAAATSTPPGPTSPRSWRDQPEPELRRPAPPRPDGPPPARLPGDHAARLGRLGRAPRLARRGVGRPAALPGPAASSRREAAAVG